MAEPVRTCVGCRRTAAKSELVRVVWRDGLVVDIGQIEPGRGAYLHRGSACLEAALRRKALGRALRATAVQPEQVRKVLGSEVT